jgi:hypothetical protein
LNRGLASAVSVALTTTVLQNRLAERLLFLAQDQDAMPLGGEELLQDFFTIFQRLGDFADMAQIKAMAMLQELFSAEAALHSYHDTFILIGWISAAGILPALWMDYTTSKAAQTVPSKPQSTASYTPTPGSEHGTHVDRRSREA